MRKCMKALGFLSVLATFSDFFVMSGTASYYSAPLNEATTAGIVSEDLPSPAKSVRARRRSKPDKAPETPPRQNETQQSPLPSNSTLFRDIVADRELFIRFDFGGDERDILCSVNREVGRKDSVGLLLLEPSGILKTLVIDRATLAVIHKKASIPHKELRAELARRGVLIADARLIARQVVGLKEPDKKRVPDTGITEGIPAKAQETVSKNSGRKLSATEKAEILERFRKEVTGK